MARDPLDEPLARDGNRQAQNRENSRKFRLRHPERVKAARKAHRLANREKIAAYDKRYRAEHTGQIQAVTKAYRLAHREEIKAYDKRYHAEHPGQQAAYYRAYFSKNPDKLLAKQHLRTLRERARVAREKSINAIRQDPDTVYRVVSRAVSSALPRFMRDDVINSMLLAVLAGELLLEHVGARMKDYVSSYNREYDGFKTLSLDAPMGGTDLKRIDLLEAPAPYEPETDDEEDPDMVMLRGGYSRW